MVFIVTFSDVRTLNFKTAATVAFLGAVAIANFIEREWVQQIVFKHFVVIIWEIFEPNLSFHIIIVLQLLLDDHLEQLTCK